MVAEVMVRMHAAAEWVEEAGRGDDQFFSPVTCVYAAIALVQAALEIAYGIRP